MVWGFGVLHVVPDEEFFEKCSDFGFADVEGL